MTQANAGVNVNPCAVKRVTASGNLVKYQPVVWSAEGVVAAPTDTNNVQAFAGFVKDADISDGAYGEVITYGEALALLNGTVTVGGYLQIGSTTACEAASTSSADVIQVVAKALKAGDSGEVIPVQIMDFTVQYN